MKRLDLRIVFGAALILLGGLMLLERFGLFRGAASIFWGIVFLAGGAYFIYRFFSEPRQEWWAVIPGTVLAGIGLSALVPGSWSGLFLLGLMGIGFFTIYFMDRSRWWGIIPGGVLVTLAITSVLQEYTNTQQTGGIFFLGLGLTFILLAVLASTSWAYIPGVILLIMGVVFGYTPYASWLNYVWPAVLIVVGLLLIYRFVRRQ